MIRGLPASLMLHAAVIGAGYIVWPYVGTAVVEDEFVIVPVDLVDVGEITNVAPVIQPKEPEPEVEEEPEPELPEPEESQDPIEEEPDERDLPEDDVSTASESAPAEEEEQDIVPDLDKQPEEEEPEPEPEPKKPEPPKPDKPNPVKPRNSLDDLLNDADSTFESERQTKRASQPPPQERKILPETPPVQETRKGAGDRSGNTVRIEQLLYNQILPCWDGVLDQPEPDRLNVQMKAKLDAEGNLVDVELVRPRRAPIGDRSMSLAVERAMRAVRKCQPYRLPRDDYELWKEANINLGPAFGGKK